MVDFGKMFEKATHQITILQKVPKELLQGLFA
jgi:hypothetical protein